MREASFLPGLAEIDFDDLFPAGGGLDLRLASLLPGSIVRCGGDRKVRREFGRENRDDLSRRDKTFFGPGTEHEPSLFLPAEIPFCL
jgi:hypothetical protein